MKQSDDMKMYGHLSIKPTYKPTGQVIDGFDDRNVITFQGTSTILNRITTPSGGSYVTHIALGDDVGNGTILQPEQATESLSGGSQAIVYEVPVNDITITYPNTYTFTMGTVLNGTDILDSNFPDEIDLRFTSATIRFNNGDVLSYKRFPVRSLSRLVDIEITWTISLKEEV